ncbi:MAG TPA: alpha/beta hydrolase [Rhizomicrobium sp.]|jgi:acetyl esterase/lipase|nr:alpha/beta hydrolase [Rhizomicrobium sp.]
MTRIAAAALAAILVLAPRSTSASASFQELLTRPRPASDAHIAYGKDALQYGDLYLPKAAGEHAVIVLIHGGCWLGALPGPELMAPMVEPLRAQGFAVWNIEYRRIGQPGGGYPGTFLDTAAAIDELRAIAPRYRLDLRHVVLVGHSAGGHLAAWAAARPRIAKTSALHAKTPLAIHGIVSLSGILDLESYRATGPSACGEPATIDAIAGRHGDPYADTSPVRLLPAGVPETILSGGSDGIVPPPFGHDYAKKAKAAGDPVRDIDIPGAGHFDMIDPLSPAWPAIAAAIEKAAE